MKTEFPSTRNPFCVLGLPPYASVGQIRSAYKRRVKVLQWYLFDKATQPEEWKVVHEMRCELTTAYVQACLARDGRSQAPAPAPGTSPVENSRFPLNMVRRKPVGVGTRLSY